MRGNVLKFFVFILILVNFVINQVAVAQNKNSQDIPKPFGLKLGISTKKETLQIIKKEGGRIVGRGYKVIKWDIVNPNVEGIEVKGLPVYNMKKAVFWFFKGKLYAIDYIFPLEMYSEVSKWLEYKYGKTYLEIPDSPALTSKRVGKIWVFKDIFVTITVPRKSIGFTSDPFVYLRYEHTPLASKVEESDMEILAKKTLELKKKGL